MLYETSAHCPRCNRQVLARRQVANNVLHFVLTVIFFPWIFIWLYLLLSQTDLRCSRCGEAIGFNKLPVIFYVLVVCLIGGLLLTGYVVSVIARDAYNPPAIRSTPPAAP